MKDAMSNSLLLTLQQHMLKREHPPGTERISPTEEIKGNYKTDLTLTCLHMEGLGSAASPMATSRNNTRHDSRRSTHFFC
jgi:hypothetical protein